MLWSDANFFSPYVLSHGWHYTRKRAFASLKTHPIWTGENICSGWRGYALTQRVPVLEADNFELSSESSAIARNTEERFAPPQWERIYPHGDLQNAPARDRFERGYAAIYCRFAKNGLPTWCLPGRRHSEAGKASAAKLLRRLKRWGRDAKFIW